jgi:dCTP deaminase
MSYIPDWRIRQLCTKQVEPELVDRPLMIKPFVDHQVKVFESKPVISYGLSSYGYDARIANEFRIFHNGFGTLIDPKDFKTECLIDRVTDQPMIVPAQGFVLGRSLEYFHIPRAIQTVIIGKSTYARCGLIVNVTPLEPEWEGHVTIELHNTTGMPIRIYPNEGIMQVLFSEWGGKPCEVSYADRKGKYQGHKKITTAKA